MKCRLSLVVAVMLSCGIGSRAMAGDEQWPRNIEVTSHLTTETGLSDTYTMSKKSGNGRIDGSQDAYFLSHLEVTAQGDVHEHVRATVTAWSYINSPNNIDAIFQDGLYMREASLSATTNYGTVIAGRHVFRLGDGLMAANSLRSTPTIEWNYQRGPWDYQWVGTRIPTYYNATPVYATTLGAASYPLANGTDYLNGYRVTHNFGEWNLALDVVNPGVLNSQGWGIEYDRDLGGAGRKLHAFYQPESRNLAGVKASGSDLLYLSADLARTEKWALSAAVGYAGSGYAMSPMSDMFPFSRSADELIFDRPTFLGAPFLLNNPNTAGFPLYGFLLRGWELKGDFALSQRTKLEWRWFGGNTNTSIQLGQAFIVGISRPIGSNTTVKLQYGAIHNKDGAGFGAVSTDMWRLSLTMDDPLRQLQAALHSETVLR